MLSEKSASSPGTHPAPADTAMEYVVPVTTRTVTPLARLLPGQTTLPRSSDSATTTPPTVTVIAVSAFVKPHVHGFMNPVTNVTRARHRVRNTHKVYTYDIMRVRAGGNKRKQSAQHGNNTSFWCYNLCKCVRQTKSLRSSLWHYDTRSASLALRPKRRLRIRCRQQRIRCHSCDT